MIAWAAFVIACLALGMVLFALLCVAYVGRKLGPIVAMFKSSR